MAWTSKLFGLLFFFFFFFFFCCTDCISTNLTRQSSGLLASSERKNNDRTNSVKTCNPPYNPAGDYCLLIDNDMRGTWSDMRDICLCIDGDLVNLQDANILYEISQYIKLNGMDDVSYWVGATDEAEEGKWVWSSDQVPVKGGTPLWGHLYGQQPDGGQDQNCAVLYAEDFHYMHSDVCNVVTHGVICQPSASEDLLPIDDVESSKAFLECPFPYDMIGNTCLQVIPEKGFTCTEARDLCLGSSSHIVKIDDANLLGSIYDYLTEREIKAQFWIGGTIKSSEDDWVWHDATPVKLGTPFWEVISEESQEPNSGIAANCSQIQNVNSYFFRDAYDNHQYGVICQYDM